MPEETKKNDQTENGLNIGGYKIDVVVQGFPGKSICHGTLGWSSVVLLRGHNRTALVDVGPMNIRRMFRGWLSRYSVEPAQVTDILLTHSHHDHSINWPLFSKSRIVISKMELDWAVQQPWGETPVPELYVRELQRWPTLDAVEDGQEVLPGVTAHLAPGHTPGCLVYVLRGKHYDVIFTGDAAKNRAELVSRSTDMTYDVAQSTATLEMIWELWRRRPGTVVVPGHDVPMVQENGVTRYIGPREASIEAWFGDDMQTTKTFELAAP